MNNEVWSWWVGNCEERYHTECATRDEALQIARDEYEGAWITEAMKPANIRLSDYFFASTFVEHAEDCAYDDHGDPEGDQVVFEWSAEQTNDLQEMVRLTIDAWQAKHNLVFTGFAFLAQRNTEFIPAGEGEK